jgi:hypothetical protein
MLGEMEEVTWITMVVATWWKVHNGRSTVSILGVSSMGHWKIG